MKDSSVTVGDLMRKISTLHTDATFEEALQLMLDEKTNTVFVVDDEGKLVGEVSVVHLLKGIVPGYISGDAIAAHFMSEDAFSKNVVKSKDNKVSEFMYKDIKPAVLGSGLMQAAVIAIERGQARIPVVDEEYKPVGVISRRGLKCIIASHLDLDCDLE